MAETKLTEFEIRARVEKFKEALEAADLIWAELREQGVDIKIDTSQRSFQIKHMTWNIDLL